MIFVGLKIEVTRCLGKPGDTAWFVAKNWIEFWKMVCRRRTFDYMAFSECSVLTREQIGKIISETQLSNALAWIENDENGNWKMDTACYFIGTIASDTAAG